MVLQEALLPRCEGADVDCFLRVNSHSLQRWRVRHGRNDHSAISLKPDESAIKQMINTRGQKQAVLDPKP